MKADHPDGATPLDPDEADGLILTHITTRGQLDRWEQENILESLDWLDRTRPTDILSGEFIKELHRRMFGKVWKWAGRFRKTDKNIGGPWYEIEPSLLNLCGDTRTVIETASGPPAETAVRFHHRLVCIHPFPNGNGRHARLMTDVLMENVLHQPRFTWGDKNLTARGDMRQEYIDALRLADKGQYQSLLAFVIS